MTLIGLHGALPGSAFSRGPDLFSATPWLLLPLAACVWLACRVFATAVDARAARVARVSSSAMFVLLIITSTGIDDRVMGLVYYFTGPRATHFGPDYFLRPISVCGMLVVAGSLVGVLAAAGSRLGYGERARRVGVLAAWLAAGGCAASLVHGVLGFAFAGKSWSQSERPMLDVFNQLNQTLTSVMHVASVLLWLAVWLSALRLGRWLLVARVSSRVKRAPD